MTSGESVGSGSEAGLTFRREFVAVWQGLLVVVANALGPQVIDGIPRRVQCLC